MPQQFEYPEEPWSRGKMRTAKTTRGLDPGKEYRELEGVRKEKETKASMLNTGKDMPGQDWDETHYSELERQIGTDNMQFIRKLDEKVLGDTYFTEKYEGKGSKGYENWLKMRQQYIDMFNRPDSGVVPEASKPELGIGQGPGPSRWETS